MLPGRPNIVAVDEVTRNKEIVREAGIGVESTAHLLQVVSAHGAPAQLLRVLKRGEQERSENGDYRDHNEQFDQGETVPSHDVRFSAGSSGLKGTHSLCNINSTICGLWQ